MLGYPSKALLVMVAGVPRVCDPCAHWQGLERSSFMALHAWPRLLWATWCLRDSLWWVLPS